MSLQELEVLRGVVESNMPSTEGIDSFFESARLLFEMSR